MAEYGSFGARFVALLIDQVLIVIGPAVVGVILIVVGAPKDCVTFDDQFGSSNVTCATPAKGGLIALGILILFVGIFVMGYLLWAKPVGEGRQTIGQRTMSVRVVDADTGNPVIGTGRAYGRWLMRTFISQLFCYLGFLWSLWDDRDQTWHDKVVNTIVVKA